MAKRNIQIDPGDGLKTVAVDDTESGLVHNVREDLRRLHPDWSKKRLEEEVRSFAERQKKKKLETSKEVPEVPKRRKKWYSRADRAADTASAWQGVAESLRALLEDKELDELSEEEKATLVEEAQGLCEDFDSGELESLAEEMRSWADNMEEHFSSTEKYERVSEAADTLESIDTDAPSVEDADDIEEAADELDSRADELEQVEFPGMYG